MAAEDRTFRRAHAVHGRRRGRLIALGVMAVVAIGATACAQEADPADVAVGDVEYEATPEFVAAAAERSLAQPYRTEMRQSVAGGDEVVVETGEHNGNRFHVRKDVGSLLGELIPDAAEADLSIETAGDGSALYLRMPAFAAMRELTPGLAILPFGDLIDDLGDDWGRIELDELADLMPGLQDTSTAISADVPGLFVNVIAKAQDVEELGKREIRGVAASGLAAEVPFEDMLGAQGTAAGGIELMNDIRVPIEVWVDHDGLVRQVKFGFHRDDVAEALGHEAPLSSNPDVDYTLDLFDYGDGSIEIEFPADAIDVTDAFRQMIESGRIGLTPMGDGG
jgi:hypothetical protein